MKTALLSVYNKTDAFASFAYALSARHGFNLLASSGTVTFLKERNIDAQDVASIVGPPILGHRVVTLSREVHAALLVRTDNAEDMKELAKLGISPIDLVYVSLYPLADAVADTSKSDQDITEMIDIGGPTMLRSANKAGRLALMKETQFEFALEVLQREADGRSTAGFRSALRAETESGVADYVSLGAEFYERLANK